MFDVINYQKRRPTGGLSSPEISAVEGGDDGRNSPVARYALDLIEQSRRYRSKFDTRWDAYYNLYRGAPWGPRQPNRNMGWKSFLVVNHTQSIIESILAVLFDQQPRVTLGATHPDQHIYTETVQNALDSIWHRTKCYEKVLGAYKNALIYGTGFLKVFWDRSAERGQGNVRVEVVATDNLFVDPNATTFYDAQWVGEAKDVPLTYVRRHYKNGHLVKGTGRSQMSYAEKKASGIATKDPYNTSQFSTPVGGDDPLIGDKTNFSNPPFTTGGSTKEQYVTLYEVWFVDPACEYVQVPIQNTDPLTGQTFTTYTQEKKYKYPHGRLVTVAGGVVLQDEPSPYHVPHGVGPYVRFVDIPLPAEFYGLGECEILRDLQMELNKRRSQVVDHAALMGNAVWIIDKGSQVDPDTLGNRPGLVVEKVSGTEVRRDPPQPLPNWILQAIELTIRDMREVTGVSGIPAGMPPRGVRSGSGFQAAEQIGNIRVRQRAHNLRVGLEDMGRLMLALIQQFYTTQRMIRVSGSAGNIYWVPFDQHAARGDWDLHVEVDSMMPGTRAARAQQAIQLYQLQLLDKRAVLETIEWPDREKILRRLGDYGGILPMPYPGHPGSPERDRTDQSGYALSTRAALPGPPPPPPQGIGGQ
ncbi:MAG TPA: hypothetical protein VEI97_12615, partial [bacterium]|nr:hypothetical protein [bacterium]